jgi:molecular chaperone DnaJ
VATKNRTGDLLVTVEVAVPQALTDEARDALEKFAATQTDDPRPQITAALARGAQHAQA